MRYWCTSKNLETLDTSVETCLILILPGSAIAEAGL